MHAFSKHLLREHAVFQIVLGACCSNKNEIKPPHLMHVLLQETCKIDTIRNLEVLVERAGYGY